MGPRLLHYSDVENAYDDPDRIGRLARAIEDHRTADTLVCATGDVTAPGFLAMETDGAHALDFLAAVDPDVSTFGNHEFDLGTDRLRELVGDAPSTWVTANLREPGGEPFGAGRGVRESVVRRVGSEAVGLFGVTSPPAVEDHGLADDVVVEDAVGAARRVAADLRDRGVDRVVALSHLGRPDDELAAAADVDAVLGGHVHDERAAVVDGTALTRPGARGRRLARVRFDGGSPAADLVDVTATPVDEDVAGRYREAFAAAGLTETVTTVAEPVPRRPADTYPESRVGNAVADAYRWAAGADVAVCNAKMLRAGPPLSGSVTLGDLRSTTPFENDILSVELDGRELLTLFENLAAPDAVDLDDPEVFAHVGGARLRWRRDEGTLTLVDATVGGDPVDPGRTYAVAAPSFAFHNDIFAPLSTDLDPAVHADQHEALAGYVRAEGFPRSTDGRMTAVEDALASRTRSL